MFQGSGGMRYIRSIILCIIATFGISGCSAVNKVGLKKLFSYRPFRLWGVPEQRLELQVHQYVWQSELGNLW